MALRSRLPIGILPRMMESVTVEPFEVASRVSEKLRERASSVADGTLIVLPVRIGENGVGQYSDRLLTMPKELRHLEVPAEFLHEPEHRIGLSEYSAEIVAVFLLGVAQNMAWDSAKTAVQYMFAKVRKLGSGMSNPKISVSIARVARSDGTVMEGVTVCGPATAETAEAIIQALAGRNTTSGETATESP